MTNDLKMFLTVGKQFRLALSSELESIWNAKLIYICSQEREKIEVLTALLARQSYFAMVMASEYALWDVNIGYILMRCMAETHIVTTWLAKFGKEQDFNKFIEYGLGQEKLLLEHFKANSDAMKLEERKRLDLAEEVLDQERLSQLLPVNIGSWLPKDVRLLAKDCGCDDVFKFKYQNLSGSVHGTWNALKLSNIRRCVNTLHDLHFVPVFGISTLYPSLAIDAVTLFQDTFIS